MEPAEAVFRAVVRTDEGAVETVAETRVARGRSGQLHGSLADFAGQIVRLDLEVLGEARRPLGHIPAEDDALPGLREMDEMLTRLITLPLEDTMPAEHMEYFFVSVFPVACQKIIRSRYFK